MNSELTNLLGEIMEEVDSLEEKPLEKKADSPQLFKTKMGEALNKMAQFCRGLKEEIPVVTYDDLYSYWRDTNESSS